MANAVSVVDLTQTRAAFQTTHSDLLALKVDKPGFVRTAAEQKDFPAELWGNFDDDFMLELMDVINGVTRINAFDAANLLVGGVGLATRAARLASTANVALTGEQTIDGVLTSASRILLKDQTAPAENGLWVTAAGAWARVADMATDPGVVPGMIVQVSEGTANANRSYRLTTNAPITLGTTALVFALVTQGNETLTQTLVLGEETGDKNIVVNFTNRGLKGKDQTSGDGITLRIEGSQGQADAGDGGLIDYIAIAGQAASSAGPGGTGGSNRFGPGAGGAAAGAAGVGGPAGTHTVFGAPGGAGSSGGAGGQGSRINETGGTGGAGDGAGAGGVGGSTTRVMGDGGVAGATGTGGTGGGLVDQAGDGGLGGATSGPGGAGGTESNRGGDGGNAANEGLGGTGGDWNEGAGSGGNAATASAANQAGGTPGVTRLIGADAGAFTGTGVSTKGGNTELISGIGTSPEAAVNGDLVVREGGTGGPIRWRFDAGSSFMSLVPETSNEGGIGTSAKKVADVYVTPGQVHGESKEYVFSVVGAGGIGTDLAAGTDLAFPFSPHRAFTVEEVFIKLKLAPTGGPFEVDVNKNGTTIFSTQANRPIIVATEFEDISDTPNVTTFAAGDDITVDIDLVGTGQAGQDLIVVVRGYLT